MSGGILVTGATGFVGRAVMPELLRTGRPIAALVRAETSSIPAGVAQRFAAPIESLKHAAWLDVLAGMDTVVHLAGIAHIGADVPEDRYDAVNHRATTALAKAASAAGVRRIVFASSIRAQTGACSDKILTEASAPTPTDPYGRSKLAAEHDLLLHCPDAVILRPSVIIGAEPKGNIASLVRLAKTGLPLPFAALPGRRSLVSIEDVVAAIIRALDDPEMAGGRFILADPDPLTLGEMIEALRLGMGRPRRLFAVPPAMIRLALRAMGAGDTWDRIGADQIARPQAITGLGFVFRRSARQALHALGEQAVRAQRQTSG